RVLHERAVQAVVAAVGAPGYVRFVAFTFAGDRSVGQEGVFPNDADASSVFTGRGRLGAQLVAVGAHREPPLELLDRVVAGVGDEVVHGVRPVAGGAGAVGALVDFEVDPVLALLLVPSGVGDEVDVGGIAGGNPIGDD